MSKQILSEVNRSGGEEDRDEGDGKRCIPRIIEKGDSTPDLGGSRRKIVG